MRTSDRSKPNFASILFPEESKMSNKKLTQPMKIQVFLFLKAFFIKKNIV